MKQEVLIPLMLALCFQGAVGQDVQAETTTVQIAPEEYVSEATLSDVNADGLSDLIIAVVTRKKPRTRTLRIHLRRTGTAPFSSSPDETIPLTPDVAAFAIGDMSSDPGQEIILFNRDGAFLRPLGENGSRRSRKLVDAAFLWQFPNDHEIISWTRGTRDLDGDGLTDLLIPEPGGYCLAFQKRGADGKAEFSHICRLRVPLARLDLDSEPEGAMALRGERTAKSVEQRIRTGAASKNDPRTPLLEVVESVPAPQLADWDGDGDLDLIIRTVERLFVWLQGKGAHFAQDPDLSYKNPLVADRSRRLDISYSAHITDLNGDNRADCVLIGGNKRSNKVRTQVLVFLQGFKGRRSAATTAESPLFGPRGIPAQLLPLAGFAALPRLDDVNGDGLPDLALATFRPDLIDTMRSSASKTIDLGYHVFLNRNGTFPVRADLNGRLVLRARRLERARGFLTARFLMDVTGDGLKDLLVQDSRSSLLILAPRRRPRGLDLPEKPVWKLTWDGFGILRVQHDAGVTRELLVLLGSQVLHVRFPR